MLPQLSAKPLDLIGELSLLREVQLLQLGDSLLVNRLELRSCCRARLDFDVLK